MALILAIDTSTKVCSVALHEDGVEIGHQAYHLQKSHSSLLPVIIKQLVENVDLKMSALQAIAISAGPGSYTGLRIGTSTAKGLCYGLGIPLISYDSLDSMYESIKGTMKSKTLLCAMIDARRMEVFCNLRDSHGAHVWQSAPLILDENTFETYKDQDLILVGNGAAKCMALYSKSKHISYLPDIYPNSFSVGEMVESKFIKQDFEDLAYFEPEYLKEYRTILPKDKLNV
ncbi:MAG: tRNA threonylcarbamoyladenosine biosynthesis protein TsaB [Cyclobacteriaceae bacterium]|jgi:tRNA threonylcarbamoyladenosine biosynthesis protein TsaB